jgi:putative endonuclease
MYILKCCDDSYYTGITTNLEQRLGQHKRGEGAEYTKKHLPVELVYYEEYEQIRDAIEREKQIKNWSHEKKYALIYGHSELLSELAKKAFVKYR